MKKQVKNYGNKLQASYNNVLEDFDQEEIHDFRLQVKKLNALLWLLNGEKPHSDLKIKKPFHLFYHTLGNYRNLQLHQERVRNLCGQLTLPLPLYYLQTLQQKETEQKIAAREQALHLDIKKFCSKLCHAAPKHVTTSMLKSFIATNVAALMQLMNRPNLQEEDLHEVRKILKRFLYVWPWIKADLHKEDQTRFLSKEICDVISVKLGDFMDNCFALRFFEAPYSIDAANAEEIPILHSLQAHIVADKQRQYDDAMTSLKTHLSTSATHRRLLSSPSKNVDIETV